MNYKQKFLKHYGYADGEYIPCVCGKNATDIHHIVFKSQGGSDNISNLVALCRECHVKVHNDKDKEFTKDFFE